MSDQQMAELYERVVAGKAKKAGKDRVFLRGWNAALDWVIKQMRVVADEDVPTDVQREVEKELA